MTSLNQRKRQVFHLVTPCKSKDLFSINIANFRLISLKMMILQWFEFLYLLRLEKKE